MLKSACGLTELRRRSLKAVQLNVGLRCNLSCRHCHVGASPQRKESMSWDTMQQALDLIERAHCRFVDLTGGAPEMNPHLPRLIRALRQRGITVQVRTNLTIHLEPGYSGLANFFRDQGVQLVASLPCYLEKNVDQQRGANTYRRSIEALKLLNGLGYGKDKALPLNLVFNPGGPSLPPCQTTLEADYRQRLSSRFGVHFSHLLTIANMPIGRFQDHLERSGEAENYWNLLSDAFNPGTLDSLMCRDQLTIRWDGMLFDCDFNLALDLPLTKNKTALTLADELDTIVKQSVITERHCLGCTAGTGSSCGGALVA
ncbi:MAG: arsenosugar biosynthesis radical SAM protein ArsS [Magnetococcales bacterium]|nr:arsenosugar biosynthesis radical SAM protein ArsS [Magnetococcales bacterium]